MHSLMLAGIVVPRIETTLGFRVAGKVISREVDVGAIVKPGQLIARIDPTDYRLAVDNARAALASAEADYARAKADLDRYQQLRGSAAFMTQTLDTRQSVSSTTLRQGRPGAGASSPPPRTTSPTPSCMPTPRASSPPSRPRSARCWRRARAW